VAAEHDARSLDGEAEAILAEIWEEVLGVEGVRPCDNFFALGGDSILGIQVAARAQARGVTVSARQVVSSRDLTELATLSAAALRIDAEQGQVTGDVPLTPIQRWFFGLGPAEPARFTQSVLLALAPDVDPEALRAAVMALPERHDALRLRYRNIGSGEPQQFHGELDGAATFDVRARTDVERHGAELKAGMDLEHGPLFRAALFAGGPADEPARLLLAAHHLVVDAVSWRILIEDLISVYVQVVPGNSMTSPIKTTSYKAWSEALQGWPADTDIVAEAERWVALAAGPEDPRHGAARTPAATAQVAFDRADTSRLLEAPLASYAIALHEMLLAALSTSPTLAGGQPAVRIDLEGHGRDDLFATVDVSRTVGWFTAQYPVRLDAAEGAAPRDVLLAVKERLRSVAHGGIGWGLLQDAPVEVAPACVRFNYLGRIDSTVAGGVVLGLADDPTGPDWPQDAAIFHPLEIEAEVLDGCLGVRLTGRTAAFDAATLASIASELESTLRAFARHFEELSAPVYSPSDFPDVELGQDELDALVTQLGAAGLDL
jgi:non-ribosomal peptide synthase protein (TIGR01720 family)